MSQIQGELYVENLDNAYDTCEALHTEIVNKGETLISDLSGIIENLKLHWKGSDATAHISNLCKLYKSRGIDSTGESSDTGLVTLVTNSKKIISAAADAMISVQELRKMDGGTGGKIGSPLSNTEPNYTEVIAPSETAEYYCDPLASNDYVNLGEFISNFNTFVSAYREEKDKLMNNWKSGAGHEDAVKCFSNFDAYIDTYNSYLKSAEENLGIAVSNIAKVA